MVLPCWGIHARHYRESLPFSQRTNYLSPDFLCLPERSEGPVQSSAECTDPSVRKRRGPQDDRLIGGGLGWSGLGLFGGFALQRALQRLIQGSFRLLVFLLRDVSLLVFDFELEEFFFQAFQQHRRTRRCGCNLASD